MNNLREKVLNILENGQLWHTTSPERYKQIMQDGAIYPDPDIPDNERWCRAGDPSSYPYVRSLGGVSLFDFKGFDPEKYSINYPISMWQTFVPYRSCWRGAIWIEIDEQKSYKNIIPAANLVGQWKKENQLSKNIMPYIECAHLGPISCTEFTNVFIVEESTQKIKWLQRKDL